MGCAQSTVKDQVHDTTPAADAAAPASPAAATDVAVTSAPPSNAHDLEFHAADESAAPIATATPAAEPVVEEAAVADEAVAPASVSAAPQSTASVTAPPQSTASVTAPPASTASVAAPPASTASVAAPPASTTSVAATHEVADAVVEDVVAAAVEAPVATEEAADVTAVEPETEVAPVAATTNNETPASGLVFTSAGVGTNDKGVTFYNYTVSNAADPAQDTKISKRFNDFKALHADVATLMANEANVAAEHQDKFKTYPALPALPKTSLFRGRSNTKQTEERDAQFLKILNAIARHPIAVESPQFKAFLA